jgi:hypothetical protein
MNLPGRLSFERTPSRVAHGVRPARPSALEHHVVTSTRKNALAPGCTRRAVRCGRRRLARSPCCRRRACTRRRHGGDRTRRRRDRWKAHLPVPRRRAHEAILGTRAIRHSLRVVVVDCPLDVLRRREQRRAQRVVERLGSVRARPGRFNIYGEAPMPLPTFLAPVAGITNADPARQVQFGIRLMF